LAQAASFHQALLQIAERCQSLAWLQKGIQAPEADAQMAPDAECFDALDLQVFYQIAVHGARDLGLAPDPYTGFTMSLLRLMAFTAGPATGQAPEPQSRPVTPSRPAVAQSMPASRPSSTTPSSPTSAQSPSPPSRAQSVPVKPAQPLAIKPPSQSSSRPTMMGDPRDAEIDAAAMLDAKAESDAGFDVGAHEASNADIHVDTRVNTRADTPVLAPRATAFDPMPERYGAITEHVAASGDRAIASPLGANVFDGDWPSLAAALPLGGVPRMFAQQSQLLSHQSDAHGLMLHLRVGVKLLADPAQVAKVREALQEKLGLAVQLKVELGEVEGDTAGSLARQASDEKIAQTQASLESLTMVKSLIDHLDGKIIPGSVKPA
jgi:DNA polymerase III subunit gamma/tau